jgi:hypothetical protein
VFPTSLTSLTVDGPGQLPTTHLVADGSQALAKLRELFPQSSGTVADDELVHTLAEHGVRAQILHQDLTHLIGDLTSSTSPEASPGAPGQPCTPSPDTSAVSTSSTYGDLFRYDSYVFSDDARQGQFMRPATALEAAYSRSCAHLDGGLGIFGVHTALPPKGPRPTGPSAWLRSRTAFIHYGTLEWDQALLTSSVRYYRVASIPDDAVLPKLEPGHTGPPPRQIREP